MAATASSTATTRPAICQRDGRRPARPRSRGGRAGWAGFCAGGASAGCGAGRAGVCGEAAGGGADWAGFTAGPVAGKVRVAAAVARTRLAADAALAAGEDVASVEAAAACWPTAGGAGAGGAVPEGDRAGAAGGWAGGAVPDGESTGAAAADPADAAVR
jgi:hypothetical protein